MKKFTTSAQKTIALPKDIILERLERCMTQNTGLTFTDTKTACIKEAKLKDGSKLVIASFDKENGKTLAMIDHKDVPGTVVRADLQKQLKQKLDTFFP